MNSKRREKAWESSLVTLALLAFILDAGDLIGLRNLLP
jgi:hypothetical protein